jgi:hypothetical protein
VSRLFCLYDCGEDEQMEVQEKFANHHFSAVRAEDSDSVRLLEDFV